MIKRWLDILAQRIRLKEWNKDNRVVIFLVCLMISMIIWLANALGKKYETTVSMPVQYINLPQNKVLINPPPRKLSVRMEAFGLTLLQHQIKLSVNPVTFNVRTFTDGMMESSNAKEFKIVTENYLPQISNQLSTEIKVLEVLPDTLLFRFDHLVKQKKKVVPDFDLSFENQYFLRDSIRFEPDSVLVVGKESVIDTIKGVKTKHYRFKDLNASVRRNLSLEDMKDLDILPRRVVVEIPVSLYTEYSGQSTINKYNVPDSLNLVTFPGKVDLVCIVAFDEYANIDASSFIFGVDFKDIQANESNLQVKLLRTPSYIKSISFQPKQVEFLIEPKE